MKAPLITEPIRLGRNFAVTYGIVLFPSLWFTKGLYVDLPLYGQVAAWIVLPFVLSFLVYCIFLFALSMALHFSEQRFALHSFVIALLAGVAAILLIQWNPADDLSALFAPMAAVAVTTFVFYVMHRGRKNHELECKDHVTLAVLFLVVASLALVHGMKRTKANAQFENGLRQRQEIERRKMGLDVQTAVRATLLRCAPSPSNTFGDALDRHPNTPSQDMPRKLGNPER